MGSNQYSGFAKDISKFFSSGTVIVFTCEASPEFPLLSVSENTEEILGYRPGYFIEHTNGWSECIHTDDKPLVFQRFQEVMDNGKAVVNEYRFKRKDGSFIWLRDELKLMEDLEKAVIFGSSIDISDRKKAELALKESKEQYQSVVEHTKDIIFRIDEKGRLNFLNQAWENRTGYDIEKSYGDYLWEYFHPEDRESCRELCHRLFDEEAGSVTRIMRCLRKDEDFYWAELFARRLPHGSGELAIIGTLTDVSADIAHQQKIESINKRLEERVDQRSEDLNKEIDKRKKAQSKLQQRLSYEKAISKCSNLLLEETSTESLKRSLRILLSVTRSDRVYMYRNFERGGEVYLDPVVEVCREGVSSYMGKPGSRTPYAAVPWWHEKLAEKHIIHSTISEVPSPERAILEEQNVKSVLAIPIFLDQQWYGYIGFANIRKEEHWGEGEVALLKTASEIIAAFEKRKMIEESLVEQRNYTEAILNSLPSIYLLMDEDLRLVQWNCNAEKYTGYSRDELKEKSAYDLIWQEDHDRLQRSTKKVLEDEGEGTELTLLTKSGTRIPYFWRGYFTELNSVSYFLCVGIDITQQKHTEKELIDEKRFNEALIESLPGIFYMIDSNGNYHRWNQNFEDELGYSSEEVRNMGPADVFDSHTYKRVEREINKVYEAGESEVEAEVVTKEGVKIPYYLTGKLFSRDERQYLVGVGHDISEQKKAREELKEREELFRNLFLQAPAAIVMVDPQNRIQSVNKSFEDLFGYDEEELLGRDIDEVIVPEEEYADAPKMPGMNYSMDSFHKEAKRKTKSGEKVDVFIAAIPVYIDNRPLAGFGMYIDITEQKRYEKEIYASLKEKHVLLQEIHHRVKNNLAVVSGLIQLQIYETEDPIIQSTLRESESRIQTMALIHEKLYQSQNLSRISCESYIRDLVETIQNTIETDKEIVLNVKIEDIKLNINQAVPFALLVNEVVTNSFKHAFKGREKGSISIGLSAEGKQLEVLISDNGIGLPEDALGNRDSLGMTLIHNFLQQLEADWEFGTDNGTFLRLAFEADDVKGSSASTLLDF